MTKNKQKNNPKFSFLYGGDFFNYYQYKVTTEQASKHWLRTDDVSVILRCGRSRSQVFVVVIRELKSSSAVYSSKAIFRGPGGTRARRGLYGTEQAICNAPTGERVSGTHRGFSGCAVAVCRRRRTFGARRASPADRPRCYLPPDPHAQRPNQSIRK